MKKHIIIFLVSILIFSCKDSDNKLDANGVFETTEINVSSQSIGEILTFDITEGQKVKKGNVLAQIDTTNLSLQKLQLKSNIAGLKANIPNIAIDLRPLESEIKGLKKDQIRIVNMVKSKASTKKQLDDINTQIEVVTNNYNAQKNKLSKLKESLEYQIIALSEQIKRIDYQINKCTIISPITGIVMVKFMEESEIANPGRVILKVANLENMILRAYVNTEQLKNLQIGKDVSVFADYGTDGKKELKGKISWISSESEFTPKTIQTQDERANLVYAIKVKVKNNGLLKIGMYGGFNIK